ncbi:MAG: hypothetical protein SFT93_03095 [Rickettsiaceae bacterium]|nr:hypothetical protein [Rickettsiaceae bacterium]
MRIGFFSALLSFLILTNIFKISFVFDRVMSRAVNIDSKTSSLFFIGNANAVDKEIIVAAAPTSDKKNKSQPKNEGSKPEANSQNQTSGSNNPQSNSPYMTNLLGVGYSDEEVKVLMELSKRREDLDKYQQQLTLKETFIKSTEVKLEEKAKELKALEDRINELMSKLEEKSSVRIKSLAKIYENMKPADASKIFDELEMPLLLEIIRNMKEQKVAPIIAQMNPQKAKDISFEFAKISDNIEGIKPK